MNIIKLKKGDRYGSLTVLKEGVKKYLPSGQSNRTVDCLCVCGNKTNVRLVHLTRGRTISCGCLKNVMNGKSETKIGRLLKGMKSRCAPYHQERHLYFDKGITVCDLWLNDFDSFEKWCKDNGFKKGLYIDRIDGNKGYNPNNCRFVTPKVNANNRSNTLYVNFRGEKISLKLLLERLGHPNNYYTVRSRLKRGWDIEKALYKTTKDKN